MKFLQNGQIDERTCGGGTSVGKWDGVGEDITVLPLTILELRTCLVWILQYSSE